MNPFTAARAEKCRRSFYYFVQQYWDVIISDEPVWNWHIEYLCAELQQLVERVARGETKEHDMIINIPPGTSKSTICSQMLPAWGWTRAPWLKFITGSHDAALALRDAVKSRDIIESDLYREMFPHIELKYDMNNKSHFENNHNGSRTATSVGGSIIGRHAHIIIVDDPVNPKKAASEVERLNANDWMDKTLSTRKVDKRVTPTCLIMQRLHENDPTGHLLSKTDKKIRHICLPAQASESISPSRLRAMYVDGLLDPVRLSREVLKEARIDLGSYGYAGQFQQAPAPDEGGILKRAWFDLITWEEYLNSLTLTEVQRKYRREAVWDIHVDGAYTSKTKNDATAITVFSWQEPDLWIKHSEEVYMEFPELIKYLKSFALIHTGKRSRILIEPKANGKSVVQQLRHDTSMNVIELPAPEKDKETRVYAAAPFIEARRCKLIAGTWNKQFIDQCAQFPNASQDGQVDNLSGAVNYYYLQTGQGKVLTWGFGKKA